MKQIFHAKGAKMNGLEERIVGHIQNEGVVNSIRQLCRDLNGVTTSKFCQWRTFFSRDKEGTLLTGGMQDKHCRVRGCEIQYHFLCKKIHAMKNKGLLDYERRWYIDTNTQNKFVWSKRKDQFYFLFIDREEFEKMILVNTLDAYV